MSGVICVACHQYYYTLPSPPPGTTCEDRNRMGIEPGGSGSAESAFLQTQEIDLAVVYAVTQTRFRSKSPADLAQALSARLCGPVGDDTEASSPCVLGSQPLQPLVRATGSCMTSVDSRIECNTTADVPHRPPEVQAPASEIKLQRTHGNSCPLSEPPRVQPAQHGIFATGPRAHQLR